MGDRRVGKARERVSPSFSGGISSSDSSVDLAPSRRPLSPWSQLSPGSVKNLVCHCSPLKGSDLLLLLISGLPHHPFHPFSSSKTFLSRSPC